MLRLATADAGDRPQAVPCMFALDDAWRVVIGIETKPKSPGILRRLVNIEADPSVSVLVDRYSADWAQPWWARRRYRDD